nr:Uncharacterised protein [Streptococcus thermophilus]
MSDPTRIPRVLDELRLTWEGQPDLSLATLFGVLAHRSVGWGTSDDELVEALQDERASHPADLPRDDHGRASNPVLVHTSTPDNLVTLTPSLVVVRSLQDRSRQPSIWAYHTVRATGPGRLLVVTDGEGVEHRLGVVTRIEAVGNAPELDGLEHAEVANAVWLVLIDGARVLISHRLHTWRVEGRAVEKITVAWERVVRCRIGEDLAIAPVGGGEDQVFGRVEQIVLLES